jgi:hypothetical protein
MGGSTDHDLLIFSNGFFVLLLVPTGFIDSDIMECDIRQDLQKKDTME